VWRLETLAAAKKEYRRRIRAKTNLQRKAVRKYVLACGDRDFGGKSGDGENSMDRCRKEVFVLPGMMCYGLLESG
jgi:hypothetical protein